MSFVIAIDGPAAAGKGTLAKALAEQLDLAYLDTGLLYRAVGVKAEPQGALEDAGTIARALEPHDLDREDLRTHEAGTLASKVAAQPEVRSALLDFQRAFGSRPPGGKKGAVLDGRDIGTVIFPDAETKLFVTASAEVRARRRYDELDPQTRPPFDEVLAKVKERDARDQGRADAPLRPAEDAHLIDTSEMTAEAVLNLALSILGKDR